MNALLSMKKTLFFILFLAALCISCKKESESYLIMGELYNCDGSLYANKPITMQKYGGNPAVYQLFTNEQGLYEFNYSKEYDEYCYFSLFIDSTEIIRHIHSGANIRIQPLCVNPTVNVVLNVKVLNPYDSNYRFDCMTLLYNIFIMDGPFVDTTIGQYSYSYGLPYSIRLKKYNDSIPNFPAYPSVSRREFGPGVNYVSILEPYPVSVCSQVPDTVVIVIK